MSQAPSEKRSDQDLLGQLETYERLSRQSERYASLTKNVEKERHSVQLHIYEKVKAEYEEKMRAVEQDRKRQEALLQKDLQDLLEKRAELDRLCRSDSERLEEIDFRSRIGEFTEEECKEERSGIEQRTREQSHELARLEEIVDRCRKSGLLPEQPAAGAEPEPEPGTRSPEPVAGSPEPEPEGAGPDPYPDQAVEEEQTQQRTEPLESAAAEEQDFEIVEEDASPDGPSAPVVHCPPNLSGAASQSGKAPGTGAGRSRPHANAAAHEYVTGYLVALEGSRQGERFPMISSNITLGSSPGIDIRLSDGGIANFHARILYKERKHFLENLDSMGRSFVNGVQAADLVELRDGDVLRLGDIKMQVEYASGQKTRAH